jgi:hypothetical protein
VSPPANVFVNKSSHPMDSIRESDILDSIRESDILDSIRESDILDSIRELTYFTKFQGAWEASARHLARLSLFR